MTVIRGEVGGDTGERWGRVKSRNMYKGPMDKANMEVGLSVGGGSGWGGGEG